MVLVIKIVVVLSVIDIHNDGNNNIIYGSVMITLALVRMMEILTKYESEAAQYG